MQPPVHPAPWQPDSPNEFVGAQIHLLVARVESVKWPPPGAARGDQFDFRIVYKQGGRRIRGRRSVRDISANGSAVLRGDRARFSGGLAKKRKIPRGGFGVSQLWGGG